MEKLIGHVAVDSGSIAIVDPGYVVRDRATWQAWSQEALSREGDGGAFEKLFSGSRGTGIWAATGEDGSFPVYGQYEDGHLTAITVRLVPTSDIQ